VIHERNDTSTHTDSLVVAIAGHTGFIGQIVVNELNKAGIDYYKIPSFRSLSAEEINLRTPVGRVALINCSGSTLQKNPAINRDIYIDNTETLKKLVGAFAQRMDSVLHMSTAHLNSPELVTMYTEAKKDSEEYLIEAASKYSFKGINLRLPTIWSSKQMKVDSLLDDITAINLNDLRSLIRSPEALIHVAPEMSLGIQVKRFLSSEVDIVGFDNSNSWFGSIIRLIDLLNTKEDSLTYIENELRRIFVEWRVVKFNS
jgi:hypothetical protein